MYYITQNVEFTVTSLGGTPNTNLHFSLTVKLPNGHIGNSQDTRQADLLLDKWHEQFISGNMTARFGDIESETTLQLILQECYQEAKNSLMDFVSLKMFVNGNLEIEYKEEKPAWQS